MLEELFHLAENKTTIRQELLGGLTTFMAMAYVGVVNPRILDEAGMPVEGVLFATCVSAAIATGLSLGLLSYTFIKMGSGKYREISPLIWVLSVLFLLRYAFLGTE